MSWGIISGIFSLFMTHFQIHICFYNDSDEKITNTDMKRVLKQEGCYLVH